MKYKAVVFDLDGTLIDSAADLGNAVNRVLAAHGFPPHKISRYQDFIGNGAEMMVKQALPEESCDELTLKRCLNEFLEDYHQNYYQTNPIRYKFYRLSCGRDARLATLWGDA